ncbi:MAG: polysaccharide/polyol phosphate ABC transporter [Geobacteraceae bacterium]|nr:MAG: polysaccharide/polyol phosphate ABC transporter [Geobacteraceae bacterium]
MTMPIIEVDHVTKEYQLGQLKSLKQTFLATASRLVGKEVERPVPFKALDGVSFSIEEGEVVGIIGTNGAGKSTLLKLISNISKPSSGNITVQGKIAPLIEVGAGLIGDLTGRENIYLNGTILGLSTKKIKYKFDEIVAFAELEEFIDTPVKRYSSGMQVRLGFSIATVADADILIVDEVLAVGDLAFQRKCFDRMEGLIKRQGKTVLLVSHNIRQIERICSRAILLDRGRILSDGVPDEVCELFIERSNEKIEMQTRQMNFSGRNLRSTGEVELVSYGLVDEAGNPTDVVTMGEPTTIRGIFKVDEAIERPEVVYGFHTIDFFYIASMGTASVSDRRDFVPGHNVVDCHLPSVPLVPGVYCLRLGVLDQYRREMLCGDMIVVFNVVSCNEKTVHMPILGIVSIPSSWDFSNTDNKQVMQQLNLGGET